MKTGMLSGIGKVFGGSDSKASEELKAVRRHLSQDLGHLYDDPDLEKWQWRLTQAAAALLVSGRLSKKITVGPPFHGTSNIQIVLIFVLILT